MNRLLTFLASAILLNLTAHAQDWAKARLEKSPRHIEWIKIKHGDREVNCSIAYPEVKDKATAVVVIHEIFGLSDWVRGVTDQLAEAGYIAIAPDFLTGTAGSGGGDAARGAIGSLPPEQILADLNAAVDYAAKLPARWLSPGSAGADGRRFVLQATARISKRLSSFMATLPLSPKSRGLVVRYTASTAAMTPASPRLFRNRLNG